MKEKFPKKNTSNEVKDEMAYCEKLIAIIENKPQIAHLPAVKEKLNVLKEGVEDTQEHLNYLTNTHARVGHKTADSSFFDYKTHLAISDERIITAAVITTGEKSDGHYLQELIEKSKVTGMEIETVIADMAYSGKNNLLYTKEQSIQLISKLNLTITQNGGANGTGFDFNKDAGLFVCPAGHLAKRKSKNQIHIQEQVQEWLIFLTLKNVKSVHSEKNVLKNAQKLKPILLPLNQRNI